MPTLLLLVLLYFQPNAPLQPGQAAQATTHQQASGSQPENMTNKYLFWGLLVNGLIAAGTLIMAVYAVIQASAASRNAAAATKSAEISERTLHLAERADILLAGVDFEPPLQGGTILGWTKVRLTFQNFGRTRARNVVFSCRFELELENPQDAQPSPLGPIFMGAGDKQSVSLQPFQEWMTEETYKKIIAGQTSLRFEAQVAYVDVFDLSHKTTFVGLFSAERRSFLIEHQEAD